MNLIKKLLCSVSVVAVSAFLALPVMAADAQWKRNDKGWWYEEANGAYPTNQWKLINNKWYYFDNIGYMLENRWVGNYYVGADGAMLVSTSTPDGYYVDATGKWVEGIRRTVNISKRSGTSSGGSGGRSSGSAVEVQEVYQEPAHQARRVQIPTMQEAIQMQILQAVIIR